MSSSWTDNVVSVKPFKMSCKDCRLRKFCLAADLNAQELEVFERIAQHPRSLERGSQVFRNGDIFGTLYTVRTGSLKICTLTPDGREQIIGFYLPGDLLGLDAMGSGVHESSAVALESTTLCAISFNRLSSMQIVSIQQRLLKMASEQIQLRDKHITLLGKESADQRLASLLVHLADRLKTLGYSAQRFNLSMTRADIGNYLSLAIETVSRQFTKLRSSGLITLDRRQLRINNLEKLRNIAAMEISKDLRIPMPSDGSQAVLSVLI